MDQTCRQTASAWVVDLHRRGGPGSGPGRAEDGPWRYTLVHPVLDAIRLHGRSDRDMLTFLGAVLTMATDCIGERCTPEARELLHALQARVDNNIEDAVQKAIDGATAVPPSDTPLPSDALEWIGWSEGAEP